MLLSTKNLFINASHYFPCSSFFLITPFSSNAIPGHEQNLHRHQPLAKIYIHDNAGLLHAIQAQDFIKYKSNLVTEVATHKCSGK